MLSVVARRSIGVLEAIPRRRVTSALKSAAIAAVIVAGIGTAAAYAFDQVCLGQVSVDELGLFRRIGQSRAVRGVTDRIGATMQMTSAIVDDGLRQTLGDEVADGLMAAAADLLKTVVAPA